jgi:hypothetical protein
MYLLRLGLADDKGDPLPFREDGDRLFVDVGQVEVTSSGGLVTAVSEGRMMGPFRLLELTRIDQIVRPGQNLALTALWQAIREGVSQDAYIEAVNSRGSTFILARRPVAGIAPWLAGEVREERYIVSAWGDLSDGDYRVQLRLGGDVAAVGRISVKATDSATTLPSNAVGTAALFHDTVRLLGYSQLPSDLKPGDTIALTLYWQSSATGRADLTTFVHLLGRDGRLYGQHDSLPAEGRRPYPGWRPNEIIEDQHRLVVSSTAPPGPYSIEIGLYDSKTLRRWPGESDGVPLAEDRLLLGPIDMRQ